MQTHSKKTPSKKPTPAVDVHATRWGVAQLQLIKAAADAVQNWSSASRRALAHTVEIEKAEREAFRVSYRRAGRVVKE